MDPVLQNCDVEFSRSLCLRTIAEQAEHGEELTVSEKRKQLKELKQRHRARDAAAHGGGGGGRPPRANKFVRAYSTILPSRDC
jgi:hypothetical protein